MTEVVRSRAAEGYNGYQQRVRRFIGFLYALLEEY